MQLPDPASIFTTLDATWPPEMYRQNGDWLRRIGGAGGSRVNAATAMVESPTLDGCGPLVMVRTGEDALSERLDAAGYAIKDPCRLLVAPAAELAQMRPAGPRTVQGEAPIARMAEIWAEGGIGPARLQIMDRATCPKTYITGRLGDRLAGCVYVGAKGDLAMLHALEISPHHRRHGVARDLVAASAGWAADTDCTWLSLIVTEANSAALALYSTMGFSDIGGYHYRIKEDTA